jgi:hypothetical protein
MATKIELDTKLLERISEYYQFPLAVFFMKADDISKARTRNDARLNRILEFEEKLKELIEEYFGDL